MGQQWWVPLIAAGIGAGATLIISWLTRRSERKRDDIKWARDAADRQAEREQNARMQWREHRVSIYRDFIGAIDLFMNAARLLTFKMNWNVPDIEVAEHGMLSRPSDFSDVAMLLEDAMTAGAAVAISATQPVRDAAQAVIDEGLQVVEQLGDDQARRTVNPALPDLKEARSAFFDCVRAELRIDNGELAQNRT